MGRRRILIASIILYMPTRAQEGETCTKFKSSLRRRLTIRCFVNSRADSTQTISPRNSHCRQPPPPVVSQVSNESTPTNISVHMYTVTFV
ncbi:hypothetical protein EV361DRAFT_280868 [Lentinula raphanica]|nr:hypothetical protein EV361DRAFT_280868 [Lentinula raphanica]